MELPLPRTSLMTRTELIPTITTDGRHIILRAIPVTPKERARRLVDRLRPKRSRERDRR